MTIKWHSAVGKTKGFPFFLLNREWVEKYFSCFGQAFPPVSNIFACAFANQSKVKQQSNNPLSYKWHGVNLTQPYQTMD